MIDMEKHYRCFKEYMKFCKRCRELYRTPCKTGKICEKCKKPSGNKAWLEKKKNEKKIKNKIS